MMVILVILINLVVLDNPDYSVMLSNLVIVCNHCYPSNHGYPSNSLVISLSLVIVVMLGVFYLCLVILGII